MHEEALGGNLKFSGDFSCSAWLHYCRFCSRYQAEKNRGEIRNKKENIDCNIPFFFLYFIVSKNKTAVVGQRMSMKLA